MATVEIEVELLKRLVDGFEENLDIGEQEFSAEPTKQELADLEQVKAILGEN